MEDKYNFISEDEIKRRTSAVWPYCHFKPGRPVDPAEIDALMNGLIDIHVHGAPAGGWLAGRPTVVHTTMEASREKVAGLVFKDHNRGGVWRERHLGRHHEKRHHHDFGNPL